MKRFNILSLAIVAIFAVSCGEPEPPTITAKSTTIRGELGEYYKVSDKPVKLSLTGSYPPDEMMFQIELEKIAEIPYDKSITYPMGTSGQGVDINIGFGIKVFDKDDNITLQVSPTATGFQGVYDSEDIKNLITMEVGETGIVRWTEVVKEEEQQNVATFEITSAVQRNTASSSSSSSYSSHSSSGSSKWDSILNEYDSYIDDYIKLINRANSGDMDAMNNAISMMSKAESLCDKLNDAGGELSSNQTSRLMRISSKLSNAAMSF